jgi:flagellar L-ring protein precursor FlgH
MVTLLLMGWVQVPDALAQTSSLGARKRQTDADKRAETPAREYPRIPRNLVYERYAWISVRPRPPKTFKPGDLLTVIIREQRTWEADANLETKKKFNIKSEIDAFLRPIDGGFGAATFRRGKPNVDYSLDQKYKTEGDATREDRLTTRLAVRIIDVKPNGTLVLEGRAKVTHDDEVSSITLTGLCRKEDVTADNTILSTQMADKVVTIDNEGALRSASSRGWLHKLMDLLRPI